ncbi:molybdopterin molybdotransferase MoeA [Phyllobacterium sp. K27]
MDQIPEVVADRGKEADCYAGSKDSAIGFNDAVAAAVAMATPIDRCQHIAIGKARLRVCSADVLAPIHSPPFDNAAMDGFAVTWSSLKGPGPWSIPVSATVAAGDNASLAKCSGGTVRIFTGAPMPEGFDTVVRQEDCNVTSDCVIITRQPEPGANVRRAGEDVAVGQLIANKGDILTTNKIALLASLGIAEINVYDRLRVGLLTTGNELVDPGQARAGSQIYNSNKFMISAYLDEPWVQIVDLGHVKDDKRLISERIRDALSHCDILLTTGGASAGGEDHVTAAFVENDGELHIKKVAMRPGKPLKMGIVRNVVFAALPGNPYAAAITFREIVLPALRRRSGMNRLHSPLDVGLAAFQYSKQKGRSEFIPVSVAGRDQFNRPLLRMLERGSAGRLFPLSIADGVAMLGEEMVNIVEGESLSFLPFHPG